MTLDVHGFDGQPMSAPPVVTPQPGAAPVAVPVVAPAPPQAPPAASLPNPQPNPTQAAAPPAAQPIVFNGRNFPSIQAAEEYSRQLVRSAEGRARATVRQEIESGRTANAPAAPVQPPAATLATAEPEGAYDVATYGLIKKQFGDDAAEDFRSRAIAEYTTAKVQGMLTTGLAPFQQTEEERQLETQAQTLFQNATAAVGGDGRTPLLPELANEADAEAIVQIWQGLPKDFAMTPKGVWHAAMIYRGVKASRPFVAVPPPPAAAPSGQSIDASIGATPGGVPGQPQASNIPRPTRINDVTGERVPL